jgi:hypothetical protein
VLLLLLLDILQCINVLKARLSPPVPTAHITSSTITTHPSF